MWSPVMVMVAVMAGLLVSDVELSPAVGGMEQVTCHYDGRDFNAGEKVTEQDCDRCFCTQFGIMCELIGCPAVTCEDKVMGKCCYECPNGLNCAHTGEHGSVLVPETGCLYAPGQVCHCYHDIRTSTRETLCWPAFPGDASPPCNSTSV